MDPIATNQTLFTLEIYEPLMNPIQPSPTTSSPGEESQNSIFPAINMDILKSVTHYFAF